MSREGVNFYKRVYKGPGNSQDAVWVNEAQGVAVIADGMGGHAGGEVASRITVEAFARHAGAAVDLIEWIGQAHEDILRCARVWPEIGSMGSTAVAAHANTETFEIVWAGDSRAYLWTTDQGLRQLTGDHSYVNRLLSAGVLSEDEVQLHPLRNAITQRLGAEPMQPGRVVGVWKAGDILLLCSDGLNNALSDQKIEELLKASAHPVTALDVLIAEATQRNDDDNISVVFLKNDGFLTDS